jgi:hypothetical protein
MTTDEASAAFDFNGYQQAAARTAGVVVTKLGIRLEDVAAANIAKIADRLSRGVLTGEGDYR